MRKYYNGNVDVQNLVRNRKHLRFFSYFHEHNVFQATLRKTLPKTKTKKKSEKQNKTNYGRRFNNSVLAPK